MKTSIKYMNGNSILNDFNEVSLMTNNVSDLTFEDIEMKYICKNCSKTYKHKSSLLNHEKFECGKEKQFRCKLCYKSFHRKGTLKRHFISVHMQ